MKCVHAQQEAEADRAEMQANFDDMKKENEV